jgi:hypothetical protein
VSLINLHREAVSRYREAIENPHAHLSDRTASVGGREAFRTRVERVVVRSTPPRAL